jgi:hypothetical protein
MSKKLAAKASLIQLPPLAPPAVAAGPSAGDGASGAAYSAHSAHSASRRALAGADAPAAAKQRRPELNRRRGRATRG